MRSSSVGALGAGWLAFETCGAGSGLAWVSSSDGSQYIELDLGAVYDIDSLAIYGRTDGANAVESRNLRMFVSESSLAGQSRTSLLDKADVWRIDTAGPSGNSVPLAVNYLPQADTLNGGDGVDTIDYSQSLVS